MYERKFITEAVVFLLAALMVVPASAVLASSITQGPATPTPQPASTLIWDNVIGVHGALGGIIVATVRSDGVAYPADDFQLEQSAQVDSLIWQGGYFQTQLAQGDIDYNWDWQVIFWNDDGGNHPGDIIYQQTIANADITREFWYIYIREDTGNHYWVSNYSASLPEPITLAAGQKYWITIQGIGEYPPQACWCRHNDSVGGILLHQAVFKGDLWGYTDWTDIQVLAPDGLPHDLNFQLLGAQGDFAPPVTTCTLDGAYDGTNYTSSVKVTLTAVDDDSGVNYTKYKVDAGEWQTYTEPFFVADQGAHTIAFYSVDKAGNSETEQSTSFTIHYLLEIAIKGGIGLTATIKNLGATDLTDVAWSITFEGGLIIKGRNTSGTIDVLANAETKVKAMPIGFGKVSIMVNAGGVEATGTGTVLLIFVIGVK